MRARLLLRGCDTRIIEEPLIRYRVRFDNGNLSSRFYPGIRNRTTFERLSILREYLQITDVEYQASIFPEIRSFGLPLGDDLNSFFLAMVSLHPDFARGVLPVFGALLLMELMADPQQSRIIKTRGGFCNYDLFRLIGKVNICLADPNEERPKWVENKISRLEQELSRMHSSSSWRLTRPFRSLASRLNALRG